MQLASACSPTACPRSSENHATKNPRLYILLGLVLAGLIHIVAVLTLPLLAPRNAHARLASLGPANTMIELPPAKPGDRPCR